MSLLKINTEHTDEEKRSILAKALIRMTDRLQLSRKELSAILGPSESSFSRLFTKANPLIDYSTKEGQLAILLVRFYCSLDALFEGNESHCQIWLRSENKHLHGIPIQLIQSIEGLVLAVQYLEAMRGKN